MRLVKKYEAKSVLIDRRRAYSILRKKIYLSTHPLIKGQDQKGVWLES